MSKDTQTIVRDNTKFAIALYQQLKPTGENLFFSPFSVSVCLAMTYGGAKQETAREMAEVLHFNVPSEQLHAEFAKILQYFQESAREILKMANRIWLQQDFTVCDRFLKLTRDRYAAPVARVDFTKKPEATRQNINNWVAKRTNQKIQDAIPSDVIDRLTRLVLTNVIYFQASWAEQFPEKNTQEDTFWLSSNHSISVPMMHHNIHNVSSVEYSDLQIIELFYRDSSFSMVILLPREIDGIEQLEQNLTGENLIQWLSELERNFAGDLTEIFLPKFSITSEFKLKKTLETMGMQQAFSPFSDFSGMSNESELVLQNVVHKAFIKVNEQGTEAAATTSAVIGFRSVPRVTKQFKVDRPFLFLIRDTESGSILFMGRVMNPLVNEQ